MQVVSSALIGLFLTPFIVAGVVVGLVLWRRKK